MSYETDIAKAIESIAATLGTTAEYVVAEYTKWYFASSLAEMAFAGVIFYVAARMFGAHKADKHADYGSPMFIAAVVLGFIAAILFFTNIADVLYPEARAINRLITSIGGGKE